MAETITGAKSKLYIKESIPGITESGDSLQHVTAQEISGNRVGLDTVIHGVYKTHVPPKLIEVGSVKRLIKITAHGARKGDILKINNGASAGEEIAIVKVEDADTIIIATEINAAIGDEVFIMRHVTPLYDEDGNLNVNATPGPAQFVQNGVDVEVEEDTVTPANNKPMPGGMYIKKDDGSWYPVTLDTSNPYAHTPIPVAITDVTGTSNVNVDLSGSSLSVNIKHDGASPSSIRIGDGTTLTSVTVNNELKVKDTDALAQLVDIEAKQDTTITAIGSLLTELQLKADLTETQPVSIQSSALPTGAATEATLNAVKTAVELVDDTIAIDGGAALTKFQTVGGHTGTTSHAWHVDASGVGRVDVRASVLPTGAATETTLATLATEVTLATRATEATLATRASEATLAAMSAKLPATLGQGTMAQSMKVVLPSDQTIATQNVGKVASHVQSLTIDGTTQQTFSAPANAKWAKIMTDTDNTVDLMVAFGTTATDTVGMPFQPGRSEDYDAVANISVIAKSSASNQKIYICWGV